MATLDPAKLYGKNEIVTTGYDKPHIRCKRRVESVVESQTSYSGFTVQLGPCLNCASPSVLPLIDLAWARRG